MDSVEADIREALPKLKAEKIQPLVELLQELAESPVDLVELEEADLADILKPLQARPLIRYFKDKYTDDDSGDEIPGKGDVQMRGESSVGAHPERNQDPILSHESSGLGEGPEIGGNPFKIDHKAERTLDRNYADVGGSVMGGNYPEEEQEGTPDRSYVGGSVMGRNYPQDGQGTCMPPVIDQGREGTPDRSYVGGSAIGRNYPQDGQGTCMPPVIDQGREETPDRSYVGGSAMGRNYPQDGQGTCMPPVIDQGREGTPDRSCMGGSAMGRNYRQDGQGTFMPPVIDQGREGTPDRSYVGGSAMGRNYPQDGQEGTPDRSCMGGSAMGRNYRQDGQGTFMPPVIDQGREGTPDRSYVGGSAMGRNYPQDGQEGAPDRSYADVGGSGMGGNYPEEEQGNGKPPVIDQGRERTYFGRVENDEMIPVYEPQRPQPLQIEGQVEQTDLPKDVIAREVAEEGDDGGLKLEGKREQRYIPQEENTGDVAEKGAVGGRESGGRMEQTDLPKDVITEEVAEKGDIGGMKLEGKREQNFIPKESNTRDFAAKGAVGGPEPAGRPDRLARPLSAHRSTEAGHNSSEDDDSDSYESAGISDSEHSDDDEEEKAQITNKQRGHRTIHFFAVGDSNATFSIRIKSHKDKETMEMERTISDRKGYFYYKHDVSLKVKDTVYRYIVNNKKFPEKVIRMDSTIDEDIYQFDGIISESGSSWALRDLFRFITRTKKVGRFEAYVKSMVEHIHLQQDLLSHENIYLLKMRRFRETLNNQPDGTAQDKTEFLKKAMETHVNQHLERLSEVVKMSGSEVNPERVTLALVLTCLHHEGFIDDLTEESEHLVCSALAVPPTWMDDTEIITSMQKEGHVDVPLVAFVQQAVQRGPASNRQRGPASNRQRGLASNRHWLKAVPLLHLLRTNIPLHPDRDHQPAANWVHYLQEPEPLLQVFGLVQELGRPVVEALLDELTMDQVLVIRDHLPPNAVLRKIQTEIDQRRIDKEKVSEVMVHMYKHLQQAAHSNEGCGDDCDKACSHCEDIMTAVIQQDPAVIQQDPAVIQQDPSTAGLVAAIYTAGIFLELCRSVKGQRNRASMDKVHDFVARNIHPQLDMLLQNEHLILEIYTDTRRSPGWGDQFLTTLEELALKAVQRLLKDPDKRAEFNENPDTFAPLLSKVFVRAWSRAESDRATVRHMLTWDLMGGFLHILDGSLSPDLYCRFKDERAKLTAQTQEMVSCLVTADFTLEQLATIFKNKEQFMSLVRTLKLWRSEVPNEDKLEEILLLRSMQCNTLRQRCDEIKHLVLRCNQASCYSTAKDLDKCWTKASTKTLSEVYELSSVEDGLKKDDWKMKAFCDIPEKTQSILRPLYDLQNCTIFNQHFEGCLLYRSELKTMDLTSFTSEILQPALDTWGTLCLDMEAGSISLKDVGSLFEGFKQQNKQQEMKWELGVMCPSHADERYTQIQRFFTLTCHEKAAKTIMKMRAAYSESFQGSFAILENIGKTLTDVPLSSMTEEAVKVIEDLKGLHLSKIRMLQVLIKSKELVRWLQKELPSVKDVRALVRLFSSSPQIAVDITNASNLEAVADIFSPLIYDVPADAGLAVFLQRLDEAYTRSLEDTSAIDKLDDLRHKLTWLSDLVANQGSEGVIALKQVESINSSGKYKVGNKYENYKDLDQIIQVTVPGCDGEAEQVYNYSKLKELQSKLMLVGGQNEDSTKEVDYFVEVLDGVTGVAKAFCNIVCSGNTLFQKWQSSFYCNRDKEVNTLIDFGLSEQLLSGCRQQGTVVEHIRQVRYFMDHCLDGWRGHLLSKRRECPALNHFTTTQIVMLRKALSDISTPNPAIPSDVFPLLHSIHPHCTVHHLKEAWAATIKEMQGKGLSDMDLSLMEEEQNQANEEVVLALLQDGFHRELIAKAMEETGSYDMRELTMWCWSKQDEDKRQGHIDSTPIQREESHDVIAKRILKHASKMASGSRLQKTLTTLWEQYLGTTTRSVKDLLSVEHLGIMLSFLKKSDERTIREFPPYFKQGRPNLVVCPKAEVWKRILSAFMQNPECPFPTREEVLLCTQDTPFEEVQLLLLRAVQDQNRMFMLVHADLLSYEVAQEVEVAIQKITQGRPDYHLVVICCSENQDRSPLVSALFTHRVEAVPSPLTDIRKYVFNKLQHRPGRDSTATSADPERFSVRIVKSSRAGVGKTLFIKRMVESLGEEPSLTEGGVPEAGEEAQQEEVGNQRAAPHKPQLVGLPLHGRKVNISSLAKRLRPFYSQVETKEGRFFHIDIPHGMNEGVDHLLFHFIILGSIVDPSGSVWLRSDADFYAIEMMPLLRWELESSVKGDEAQEYVHHMLDLLPTITCHGPDDSLKVMVSRRNQEPEFEGIKCSEFDQLMDPKQFKSESFQRVYQYLKKIKSGEGDEMRMEQDELAVDDGDMIACLQTLLEHCGVQEPSWSELNHFVQFLNIQWKCYEQSIFCHLANVELGGKTKEDAVDNLPDLPSFVVKAMLQMSKDFATRSLVIAEKISKPYEDQEEDKDEAAVDNYQFKRKWEASPHPYVFFNSDNASMTFLGYCVDEDSQNLLDPRTKEVIQEKIMTPDLYAGLTGQKVDLNIDFDDLPRHGQLEKLGLVMGIPQIVDPDEGYVLTSDNVKKMLAIHMRFRCNIPVIIMGESGCGKTYLINFMCQLQKRPDQTITNRFILKVHGGTKMEDVVAKVKEAESQAKENHKQYPDMYTVLFLDEVNTTEALGLVKEVLCDGTLNGEPLDMGSGLRLVAACNPYKMHSKEMVKSLEEAGLGYRVRSEDTMERFGRVPMRNLVYRVEPLPQSLMPLVWDFGELDENAEILYTKKIVARHLESESFKGKLDEEDASTIVDILHASQCFMRNNRDECSLVSLRDLERAMVVLEWFVINSHHLVEDDHPLNKKTWALIMTLSVCYHASLVNRREAFRDTIAGHFKGSFSLPNGGRTISSAICKCQDRVVREMRLPPTVACNEALSENIFMMVVCMELRIPLFIIGKPGSSKSLARQVLADAMEGPSSYSTLFKKLKKVSMVPYQCSPHSTSEGIVGVFGNCALLQKDQDLDTFVATVILDEVGLAEDSPKLPLKTLHHLLEQGCQGAENQEPHRRVGFIGISNWALDPGKINRGLKVQRAPPSVDDLKDTAKSLSQSDRKASQVLQNILPDMAEGYFNLYNNIVTEKKHREFFGLRDFYSLVKMLHAIARDTGRKPDGRQIRDAILRNFGGLLNFDPLPFFHIDDESDEEDYKHIPTDLIRANLEADNLNSENRYLLLLTESPMALSTLQENFKTTRNAVVIYGSSFPKDIDFTKICRTINRIKLCMETGKTVILLNLGQVYESLYDALNQYYTKICNKRLVEIGLGSQRMKCQVHEDFKLLVMESHEVVYKTFPIPLINRFEKHLLSTSTVLNPQKRRISQKLTDWAKAFSQNDKDQHFYCRGRIENTPADTFIGYHEDAPAVIVLQVCKQLRDPEGSPAWEEKVVSLCKRQLLQCATPEAIVRINQTEIQHETQEIRKIYLNDQRHESLSEYLALRLQENSDHRDTFIQVTTHSRLLSAEQCQKLGNQHSVRIKALPLKAFGTEQEFSERIRAFFCAEPKNTKSSTESEDPASVLLIQCGSGHENQDWIACSRHIVIDEYTNWKNQTHLEGAGRHVMFLIQLPRRPGGCFSGFQLGHWECVHIDELYRHQKLPPIQHLLARSVSSLIEPGAGQASDSLDFKPLFESCIIPAMSKLKDEGKTSVGTARIRKLNQLYSREDETGEKFREIMQKRIHLLQCDKERRYKEIEQSNNWLSIVVQRTMNTKMLTLAAQVWQYFEMRVTTFIAQIIGFADNNNNLDLLLDDATPAWKCRMWLRMLNNPQVTQLGAGEDMEPANSEDLEILVKTYGAHGSAMTGCLPFSWVIKRAIDSFPLASVKWRGRQSAQEVGNVLKNGELWKVLQGAFDDVGPDAVKKAYLCDFVAMVYKVQTDHKELEYQLVQETLMSVYEIIRGQDQPISSEHILPLIHAAYESIKGRLQIFSQIIQHFPQVVQQIKKFKDENPNHMLFSPHEMVLDMLAMKLQIKNLQPTKKLLRDSEACRRWYKETGVTAPLITALFARIDHEHTDPGFECYGDACKQEARSMRTDWERMSAVRIFAAIVCPPGSEQEKDLTVHCPILWMDLQQANMKTRETMVNLDNVLETIITRHTKIALKLCACCRHPLVKVLLLPCGHEVCTRPGCLDEDYKCHMCKQEHPGLTDPVPQLSSGQQNVNQFREKCRFYYLELVSTMCLSGTTCPEKELVELLMEKFVTGEVLADSSEEEARDSQTVYMMRTVHLHLLLYSDPRQLQLEMDKALSKEKILRKRKLEMALMYVQCMEDDMHNRQIKHKTEDVIDKLEQSSQGLPRPGLNGHKLESIAQARFGLSVAACYINQVVNGESQEDSCLTELLAMTQRLCTMQDISWPRQYLTKLLVRQFGLKATQTIFKNESFSWLRDETLQEQGVSDLDPFRLLGADFKVLHEKLLTALVEQNFEGWMKDPENTGKQVLVALALMAGVDLQQHMGPTYLETIQQVCTECTGMDKKDVLIRLLTFSDQLREKDRDIRNLLLHFAAVLLLAPQTPLLQPLQLLMAAPTEMSDAYLPTMPQDDRMEAIEAVFKKEWHVEDARGLNVCPNGHPYAIGDCGRPNATAVCPERGCGAVIGSTGKYNVLATGNTTIEFKDETKKGHILGEAITEPGHAFPERNMSLVQTSLVRLFVHMCLYAATDTMTKDVCGLMDPAVPEDGVADFLWRHILQDLQLIGQDMGHDDTLLLVHKVIIQLGHISADELGIENPRLTSKMSRQQWEDAFVASVLADLLSDKNAVVQEAYTQLLNSGCSGWSDDGVINPSCTFSLFSYLRTDPRFGPGHDYEQQRLLHLVHESDDGTYYTGNDPVDIPIMWRYRVRVDLGHVTRTLTEQQAAGGAIEPDKYPILHYFLEKEELFRSAQRLPSILKLQRILLHDYDRKITRSVARKRGISPKLKKEHAELIDNYCKAWNILRDNRHKLRISEDKDVFSRECLPEDPLIYYLPSKTGKGAHLLTQTLVQIHNDLMEEISKRSNNCILGPDLKLLDVTPAHIVTYDLDRDLLPIIITNCTSSLEVGKGTHIKYDFASMEYQLKERILQGRSRILDEELEMVFSDNLTAVNKLRNLDSKIKQEPFELGLQADIRQKHACYMSDVCELLTNLDTVIGFLHSVGGDPDRLLGEFMSCDLTMDVTIPIRMQQKCHLKHVKALWLLMSNERERLSAEQGGEPFSLVEQEGLKSALTETQQKALYDRLPALNLHTLLLELYECIAFHLANTDGDSINFNWPFISYLNEIDGMAVSCQAFDLPDHVDPVLVGQSISAWRAVNDFSVGRMDV